MAWVKLDDQFPVNSKSRVVGVEGRMLYITSLCWCAMQLNDGLIPASDLQAVAVLAGVPQPVGERLIDHGLWHREGTVCEPCAEHGQAIPVPSGYVAVHGFLERNESRSQIEERRRKDRERKRPASGEDSAGDSRRNPSASSRPVPSPGDEPVSHHPGNSREPEQPVDNSTMDDEISQVPAETWEHYAQLMLDRQAPGEVKKPKPWKGKTAANARIDHGKQALAWWLMFDVEPRQLAAWLIDGKPSPYAKLREETP